MARSKTSANLGNEKWTFYLLIFFFALEYIRPFDNYLSVLSPFKLMGLTSLALFFVFLKYPKDYMKDSLLVWFYTFMGLMAIMTVFAVNNASALKPTQYFFWMTLSVIFPTILILNSPTRIITFFRIWIFIQFAVTLITISQFGKGPGSFLGDENDVACVINMAIPFVLFSISAPGNSKLIKLLYIGILIAMVVGIVLTSSRGGFLGFVAVLLAIWWFSKSKIKNLLIAGMLALTLGGIAFSFVPDAYVKDMQTISDKDNGTRNLRFLHWTTGWEIFKTYPIAGVGPNNYPWNHHRFVHLSPYYDPNARFRGGRAAHSLYFTLIPELGLLGIIIYITIMTKFYRRNTNIIKQTKDSTDDVDIHFNILAKAMLASMFTFLVNGLFISVLYYPLFWHLMGFAIALYIVQNKRLEAHNDLPKKFAH